MPNAADFPRPLSPAAKAGRFFCLLMRPVLARRIGTLVTDGYLARKGWVRSVLESAVVDDAGEPLPWLTYPCVDFLASRLRPEWNLFEYGAGASTLYFARRVKAVASVEHDEAFAAGLRERLPANANLTVRPAGSATYAGALAECGELPDLVLIDGVDRAQCIEESLRRLAPSAVLVLDDAERSEYAPSVALLKDAGFRSIEFWGLAPGLVSDKCTTVFYRPANVLGL